MVARRGYQGKRFKVEDYQNECVYHLSADEFQVIKWFSEKNNERKGMDDNITIACPVCNSTMAATQTMHGSVFVCGECKEEIPINRDTVNNEE